MPSVPRFHRNLYLLHSGMAVSFLRLNPFHISLPLRVTAFFMHLFLPYFLKFSARWICLPSSPEDLILRTQAVKVQIFEFREITVLDPTGKLYLFPTCFFFQSALTYFLECRSTCPEIEGEPGAVGLSLRIFLNDKTIGRAPPL